MRNKKSVLMTLNHNFGCFSSVGSGIAGKKGLAKWGNYTHKSRLELLMFNKSTNAQ